MARRQPYDPLDFVPSPEIIQQQLDEAQTLAERLRILLELSERLRLPLVSASELSPPTRAKGGRCE